MLGWPFHRVTKPAERKIARLAEAANKYSSLNNESYPKLLGLVIAGALLCGCKAKTITPTHNPDSIVTKKIFLKDITTGVAPGAALTASYGTEWSYFGEKRIVEYTAGPTGLVTSIKFNLNSEFAGQQLQNLLEKKLSEENGKKVAFDCLTSFHRLAVLDNMDVTQELCTVRSDTQTMTIKRVRPTNERDAHKYPTLSILYDNTEVMLTEPALDAARIAADRVKFNHELKADQKRAESDI